MKRQYENISITAQAKKSRLFDVWPRIKAFCHRYNQCSASKVFVSAIRYFCAFIAAVVLWYISYVQIKAVRVQNDLTKSVGKSQAEREEARFKSQEVRDILINGSSPVESQIFALRQLPDAMRMTVHGVDGEKSYPNAESLRRLLLLYIRQPHGSEHGHDASLSSEIVRLLHKLGPADPNHPEFSIWKLRDTASKGKGKTCPPTRSIEDGSPKGFDLSHMEAKNFVSFQAPSLFKDIGSTRIIFPRGTNFGGGNFEGADLSKCEFREASFRNCNLKEAVLPHNAEIEQKVDFSESITK